MADKEAERKIVNVEGIFKNTSKKGKTYWTVKDTDGEYYNIWDEKVANGIAKEGAQAVMVESVESGDKVFHNITGIADDSVDGSDYTPAVAPTAAEPTAAPAPAPVAQAAAPVAAPSISKPVEIDMIDIRKVALTASLTMFERGAITPVKIQEVADKFVNYILGQKGNEQKSSSITEQFAEKQ